MTEPSDLAPLRANYVPLTPLSFLAHAAQLYPNKTAIIDGDTKRTYRTFKERADRLSNALTRLGVEIGDRVAVLAWNTPEMLEAHFGVPGAGAVLVSINTRLDAQAVEFILNHCGASVLLFDREFAPTVRAALADAPTPPILIAFGEGAHGENLESLDYEAVLAAAPTSSPAPIADEWQSISLNYTSGTTGDPKGVLLHHRGAYLNACGTVLSFGLTAESVYLWSLPMFHCNGWCYTWSVALVGGTHVCLRKFDAQAALDAIGAHGVTHMCGAPVVLSMLAEAGAGKPLPRRVRIATGGAAPTSTIIARMENLGFAITHLYGMTESYGPSLVCTPQGDVEVLPLNDRATFYARQGVAHPMVEAAAVIDAEGRSVPRDGVTIGELAIRSNTVMKGYFANAAATTQTLGDGWLRTGDLAVQHPDTYIEIKDRLKDIIISGGENVSSLEIEETLCRHPDVEAAAVVAHPDPVWGETPHAFVELRDGASAPSSDDLIVWCQQRLAGFKRPRHITFGALPRTTTGKVQKQLLRELSPNEAVNTRHELAFDDGQLSSRETRDA